MTEFPETEERAQIAYARMRGANQPRSEEYRVRFTHYRFTVEEIATPRTMYEIRERAMRVSPHGGVTACSIVNGADVEVAHAEAKCSPRDGFNRKIGRDIAYGRALKALADRTDSVGPNEAERVRSHR